MKISTFVKAAFTALALGTAFTSCATSDFLSLAGSVAADAGYEPAAKALNSMSKAAEEISPENEYYIGRSVTANILTNYKVYENYRLEQYLNKICQVLVVNSEDPELYNGYHVKILDSSEVNAFSTSAGHILITRGLIDCTSSEDELAAVIAHEIGHIQLKHSLKSIKTSRYTQAIKDTVGAALATNLDNAVGEVISDMVNNGYSQQQEFDADSFAIQLMADSGYDPQAIIGMLQNMKSRSSSNTGKGLFKTHPSPDKRITNANKTLPMLLVNDTKSYRIKRYNTATK